MLKVHAVAHYGSQKKLGEAIGRAQSTIACWGDIVPIEHAVLLERITRKALKVDLSLYDNLPPGLQ